MDPSEKKKASERRSSERTRASDYDSDSDEENECVKAPAPDYPLDKLFTELNMEDVYKTLKSEHDIDSSNFWDIDHEKLMEQLKITKIGTKERIRLKVNEINEANEKKYKPKMKRSQDSKPD